MSDNMPLSNVLAALVARRVCANDWNESLSRPGAKTPRDSRFLLFFPSFLLAISRKLTFACRLFVPLL